eukprot:scaffold486586_cov29-Prasinocladus_malaysianus.AAC.1
MLNPFCGHYDSHSSIPSRKGRDMLGNCSTIHAAQNSKAFWMNAVRQALLMHGSRGPTPIPVDVL